MGTLFINLMILPFPQNGRNQNIVELPGLSERAPDPKEDTHTTKGIYIV